MTRNIGVRPLTASGERDVIDSDIASMPSADTRLDDHLISLVLRSCQVVGVSLPEIALLACMTDSRLRC